MSEKEIVKQRGIQNLIFTIRGIQVMIDSDLAVHYDVELRALNQAVKRNSERFPQEVMFQLTEDESHSLNVSVDDLKIGNSLRFQSGTLKNEPKIGSQGGNLDRRGQHRKYLPYAFTEQGIAMLSAILRGETAIKASIQIMNAFVAMRRFIATNGQIFDAYRFVSDLFRNAKKSIVIIDNYIDDTVLTHQGAESNREKTEFKHWRADWTVIIRDEVRSLD